MTALAAPTTALLPAEPPARTRGRWRQLGIDTGFVLLGLPLSITAFTLVLTGFNIAAGLLIVWVGLPLAVLTLFTARGLAAVERLRLPAVLGRPVPQPVYRAAPAGSGRVTRILTPLGEPQYWLDALHGVLHLVVSVLAFSVVVTWWSAALGGLSYGLWDWSLPYSATSPALPAQIGLGDSAAVRIVFFTVAGALFAVTLPFVVRAMALLEAQLGRVLLTLRAGTRAELGRLAEGREAAVAAEAVALRRLERDIHDGPQQRLVRLSMDLHRVARLIDSDPDAARTTLAEATTQTRETLEELRALSRGIAPPVLADRGLGAALAALAARSPVPIELDIDLPDGVRQPPVVENTAYFVVSEALANVAKHSEASLAQVSVAVGSGRLRVEVVDDGRGGAVLAPGHGLAGLADRLFAVDGVLVVDSPRGGPTRLTGELPCG